MKKNIKNILSCALTVVLVSIMIYRLGILVRPTDTDGVVKVIKTFHDMPHNSIEVIGYGSSHILRGMDPMEMYKKYGVGAYNYGGNWQHINTTKLFLEDSLLTQSPKIALIETFKVDDILQDIPMDGEIYYTRAISEFEGKRQYLKQCFRDNTERYLSYYVPLCAFHSNWINLGQGNFLENSDGTNYFSTMGFVSLENVTPITIPDPSAFESKELSSASIEILDKIVSLCKNEDIDIIFYTAPYAEAYPYGDAMKKYAKEKGCIYFNLYEYVDEIGINGETDFSDKGHLNNKGAARVADFLGEYIVANYDVTDMRKIEGNMWEANIPKYT